MHEITSSHVWELCVQERWAKNRIFLLSYSWCWLQLHQSWSRTPFWATHAIQEYVDVVVLTMAGGKLSCFYLQGSSYSLIAKASLTSAADGTQGRQLFLRNLAGFWLMKFSVSFGDHISSQTFEQDRWSTWISFCHILLMVWVRSFTFVLTDLEGVACCLTFMT